MVKNILLVLLDALLGSDVAFMLSRNIYFKRLFPFVQAVTYHDTPDGASINLRRQLEWYSENFVNCDLSDLRDLITLGVWKHNKPGLIISFDDGLRSNFDVALPLLEKYGFTGWFMIPAGFVDSESCGQIDFALRNLIDFCSESYNERIALSWEEVHEIDRRGHVVTCHSMNHIRLSDELTHSDLEFEIRASKDMLESQVGHAIDAFTWVGGEEWAYGRKAYEMTLAAKYALAFCTNCAPITAKQSPFFLERYHVEPNYKMNRLRLVLGGFYDFMYTWKRRRVLKKLETSRS